MARKTLTGLVFIKGVWHIDKQVKGYGRLCESTRTSDRAEAERYLIHRLEQIRQAVMYGVAPKYTFGEAAAKMLLDNKSQRSIGLTSRYLTLAVKFIGELPLDRVHDDTVKPIIEDMKHRGNSPRTINLVLQRVTRVLRLAATKYRDATTNKTWLSAPPILTMQSDKDARDPYPLSWDEQRIFFRELPARIGRMALFKVNTGTREQEVCKLRWNWEVRIPELDTSVFIIPKNFGGRPNKLGVRTGVKNGEDRLVVLNAVAKAVIEELRGQHPIYVFGVNREGKPLGRMLDTSWKIARSRASEKYAEKFKEAAPDGFRNLRVHDLKHTFGRRLRAVGVPFEDRQALLGHKTRSVTSDYSAAEVANLIDQANKVCASTRSTPTLTILKKKS